MGALRLPLRCARHPLRAPTQTTDTTETALTCVRRPFHRSRFPPGEKPRPETTHQKWDAILHTYPPVSQPVRIPKARANESSPVTAITAILALTLCRPSLLTGGINTTRERGIPSRRIMAIVSKSHMIGLLSSWITSGGKYSFRVIFPPVWRRGRGANPRGLSAHAFSRCARLAARISSRYIARREYP